MRIRRSAALGVLFPESRRSIAGMRSALEFLCGKVECVEFCYDGGYDGAAGCGRELEAARGLLRDSGLAAIYVAVIRQKEQNAHLCDIDKGRRERAVALLLECVDRAHALGCESVMICSGRAPSDPADIPAAERLFVDSVKRAIRHTDGRGYGLSFLLEPCDSAIDARHLIGPSERAVLAVESVSREYPGRLYLTMDTAHLAEEGEDVASALRKTSRYCRHVHFADCILDDLHNELYGDKHVSFDWPGGRFGFIGLGRVYSAMQSIYGADDTITLAIEALCREPDPCAHFSRMAAGLAFWDAPAGA
jgi:sugar phosphate isomerase/epimerase